MTLSELSLRNARRQAQDYLVYFATIVMAAALVYAFNGLVFSQEIRALSGMMDSLPLVIVLVSIAVVGILGWLVHYTIGFMLSRRSRELGTYILIGLENRQVARLFFLENLAVGGVALVLGTLLGNLVFQALRAVTLALFHVPYTFGFSFSIRAVGLTLLYFGLIYLLALFKSRRRIRGMKICDLFSLDRQNEEAVIQKSRRRRRIFAASLVSGVVGTALLLLRNLTLGILGALFIIFFLYGFFISFSSGVPAYFEGRKERKYRGHTLLIFRGLSAKLATMGVAMATIALLFTATLISEGSGMVFNALFQSRAEQTTCFDLFIASTGRDETRFDQYLAYLDGHVPVDASHTYAVYRGADLQVTKYIEENTGYYRTFEFDTLMRASDYAALRAMLGYPAVTLGPGQYLIHCMAYLEEAMTAYAQPLTVGGATLTPGGVRTEHFTQSLWDGNGRGFILVVPDAVAESRPVSHHIYAAMTPQPVPAADFQAMQDLRDARGGLADSYDTLFSKAAAEAENAAMYAVIVFPLFYLALVLTMVSATILTIQQLSDTDRYRRQFQLLEKLGMDRREMRRTLNRQFAIYYTMPAVPPLLIGVPFILALGSALDPGVLTGPAQLLLVLGATLGIFFFIYFVYILLAYVSMKRNVLPG
ncbi:FtsX-like permease family protein [uncultured Oscillibacter sp.]|uniref:FtsX-like permease family protein n=1 Tax=uncultured Oscillibacter sp. TaxID=876091 RepID=UPI0025D0F661|nr:ABC transporter permease [uncultured Oscillibacter sp.]